MKLQRTVKRVAGPLFSRTVTGSGWVLFGSRPDDDKWFERRFPSKEAALAYAAKRGWEVLVQTTINQES